jgi:deazaflavin-dependent oxidoreductase (nitroreductase family)
MGARATLTDAGMRALNGLHRLVIAVSGGKIGKKLGPMDVVELHTVGRSTGAKRSTMLTTPVHDAERLVLVASKGGSNSHPQWYLNLCTSPDVELTVAGRRRAFVARTATPVEKSDLWPAVVAAYPGYARYQRKTNRDIPLVICEPRGETADG